MFNRSKSMMRAYSQFFQVQPLYFRVGDENSVRSDEFLIKFSDGQTFICESKLLQKLDFFKNLDKKILNLDCKRNHFRIVSEIILQKKLLSEALMPEDYDDLFIYEKLMDLIKKLHPSFADELIEDLKAQFGNMPLPIASRVKMSFDSIKKDNMPASELVLKAREIVVLSTRFSDPILAKCDQERRLNEANEFFYLRKFEKFIKNLQQPRHLENMRAIFQEQFAKHYSKSPLLLDMRDHHFVANHIESDDPDIRSFARKSKEILDAYREETSEGLRECGADRDSPLLTIILNYPYIFDYYGIYYDKKSDTPLFNFTTSRGGNFGFRLKNSSYHELENEIIGHDIFLFRNQKKRLFPEKIAFPPTPQAKELHKTILPILENWNEAPQEKRDLVKQKLIEFNLWNVEWAVNCNAITLTVPQDLNQKIVGTLHQWNHNIQFYFTLQNCIFLPLIFRMIFFAVPTPSKQEAI